MSQLMEAPPLNGSSNPRNLEGTVPADPQQGFDIIKVLWRWKWLPILGAIIGTGLGYLYFAKQPEEFKAAALVQVVDALPPASNFQAYDPNELTKTNRRDESIVIRSQTVLSMAVDLMKDRNGKLTDQALLLGDTDEAIVAKLMGSRNLVVQPGVKDDSTTLLEISYVSTDADLAATVVNAIVAGYSDYLTEEYRTFGNEIYELLNKAEERLNETYRELAEENERFKENSKGIAWSGDKAFNPHAESYNNVRAEIAGIQIERNKLRGTLQHVATAIEAGRPPEQILLMLTSESENYVVDNVFLKPMGNVADQTKIEKPSLAPSALIERNELAPMLMKERELLDTVGEGHPSISTLRRKIELLREHIAQMADAEKQESLELAKLRAQAEQANEDATGAQLSVDKLLEIRVESLKERLASLAIQESELERQSTEYLAQSNELQRVLGDKQLINSKMDNVQNMLEIFQEKLNAIELLPQAGQRTLKELNLPSVGGFYGPKLPPYLLGGAAVGFLIMSGLAVLMDLADRSYRSPDEIAADLGMPVLGHVPIMDIQKVKKVIDSVDSSLTTIHHSRGRVSEAFRAIRTGLFFSNRGTPLKVIQVTSPVPGDGKSTLSSNLAVTMAQSGRRVLLIDADFRRPRIAKLFGIDAEVGIAQVVGGKAEIEDATYTSNVANLSIMPGGKRPSNPAELLSSNRFHELMDLLRERYDIIIVDTPPLLAVSDPGAVSAIVDGVVLTMRLRRNVKPLATRATKILESVDARLLGVVVNGVSAEAGYGYSYGYNDYRYAYRYGGNYRYGYKYGYGYRYGGYSAGYIDDRQESNNAEAVPKSAGKDQ